MHLLSPLVPSTYLLVGLNKVEFGDLQKFALLPSIGVSLIWLATSVLLGTITLDPAGPSRTQATPASPPGDADVRSATRRAIIDEKTTCSLFPVLTALLLSLCGGQLFKLLHMPLPWMLGPMVPMVGLADQRRQSRRNLRRPPGRSTGNRLRPRPLFHRRRHASPAQLRRLHRRGSLRRHHHRRKRSSSRPLKRLSGISGVTAFFASVPGGASEMAVLAERAGARFDQVALAHAAARADGRLYRPAFGDLERRQRQRPLYVDDAADQRPRPVHADRHRRRQHLGLQRRPAFPTPGCSVR